MLKCPFLITMDPPLFLEARIVVGTKLPQITMPSILVESHNTASGFSHLVQVSIPAAGWHGMIEAASWHGSLGHGIDVVNFGPRANEQRSIFSKVAYFLHK